jgi:hypothetical protein
MSHDIFLRALGYVREMIGETNRAALKDGGIENTQAEVCTMEIPMALITSI